MVYGYWDKRTGKFRKLTRISSTTVLIDKKNIQMGDNVWIGHHCVIDGSNGIKIGEGVQIGMLSGILSHSSHISIRLYGKNYINVDKHDRLGYARSSIEIGDYSFIGAGACVLPGVKIGCGCLIAAGTIVNKDLPDFSIAAGNPVKIIGSTLDMDKKYFDDPVVQQYYFDQEVIKKVTATK